MRGYSYRKIKLSRRRNEQYLRGRLLIYGGKIMKITIAGKEQELNFGVRFVRELDKVAGMEAGGMSLGMGLTKSLPALNAYDPAVLSDVIYSATFRNSPRVSRNDVDDYLDGLTSVKEFEKLFDDVSKEVKKANVLKVALKNMQA